MVRALPRRGAAADASSPRTSASASSASTTRTRRQCAPLPRPLRQSVRRVGVDANGRASIEWGVYGVPETFVVGRDGTIAYKLVGPITPDNVDSVLKPEIEKALTRARASPTSSARRMPSNDLAPMLPQCASDRRPTNFVEISARCSSSQRHRAAMKSERMRVTVSRSTVLGGDYAMRHFTLATMTALGLLAPRRCSRRRPRPRQPQKMAPAAGRLRRWRRPSRRPRRPPPRPAAPPRLCAKADLLDINTATARPSRRAAGHRQGVLGRDHQGPPLQGQG